MHFPSCSSYLTGVRAAVFRGRGAGFSLVEVVVALGVFAVAMLGVIGLLSVALQTSVDTQRDSAIAAMLHTLDVEIRAASVPGGITALTGTPLYFDITGKPVDSASTAGAYYKVMLSHSNQTAAMQSQTKALLGLGNVSGFYVWTAAITYPVPANAETILVTLSRSIH